MSRVNMKGRNGPRISSVWGLSLGLGLGLTFGGSLACETPKTESTKSAEAAKAPRKDLSNARAQAIDSERAQGFGAPLPLLELPLSAYGQRLAFDDQDIVLLTEHALYRFRLGKPLETKAIELGYHSLLTKSFLSFWKEGRFYRATKLGDDAKPWLIEKDEPAEVIAFGDDLAYSYRSAKGHWSIRLARAKRPKTIFETSQAISSLTALSGTLFFVERSGTSWRLGAISLDGGSPRYSTPRETRPPSALHASENALIYYEGLGRGVRRVSPDFVLDEPIDADIICSPLAVRSRVYCASIGGIGVLEIQGSPRKWLPRSLPGPLAAIAASDTHIAWLVDSGREHLTLEAVEFHANKL